MKIITQLSNLIFNARSSEDAAVLVLDYLDSLGSMIKKDHIDSDPDEFAIYNLLLERAGHKEPVLRNVLALSIAKDMADHRAPVDIALTLLELLYFSGVDVHPGLYSRSELDYIGQLITTYSDDFNLAAVAFIDFMDKEGSGIIDGGHIENDKDFYLYLSGVN